MTVPFTCTPSRFARSYSRRVSSAATMSASASSAFNRSEASPTLPIGVAASTTVPLGTMTVRGAAFGSVASGTVASGEAPSGTTCESSCTVSMVPSIPHAKYLTTTRCILKCAPERQVREHRNANDPVCVPKYARSSFQCALKNAKPPIRTAIYRISPVTPPLVWFLEFS